MATLKCKMCGGDLELIPDVTVAECPYCGTKQTVPNADNEKKMTLFSRANRLRFNNEFDKAAGVYETIIGEFPEEAEAYWGLVLCKYGIEYVDDPATAKKIPTCHRSSFDSVMEDENLELAMEYADAVAKRMYREEAKQIEEIRRGILEVSSKEEPYDVFICYKETDESGERTLDSVLAQDIYSELTEKGYRVFFSRITLEDKLGQEYEPYIFAALHSARVMLAVGTSYEHYDAVWVKNEWNRYLQLIAAGEKKTLIPCYKDLDAYDMPKEFAKLQAQDLGKVGAMQDLVRGVEKILGKSGEQSASTANTAVDSGLAALNAQKAALLKRGYMALEDGEFDKADDFFDQVLNSDAECGQAYLGKTMAAMKKRNKKGIIDTLVSNLENNKSGEEKVLNPDINLIALAREADAQTRILSEFTDQELGKLLDFEFNPKPKYYKNYLPYYQKQLEKCNHIENLKKLAGSRDFRHAIEYGDSKVQEDLNAILAGLTDWLKRKIEEEKRIPAKLQEEQEKERIKIKETIFRWLQKAPEKIARLKTEAESNYEKQMAEWEQARTTYSEQYNAALEKQSELQEKIVQLEQKKATLKGLFVEKKRKEMATKIAMLKVSLAAVTLPQDPGDPPVKKQERAQEKALVAAAVFPFQAVREELARAAVRDKVYFGKYPYDKEGNVQKIQWRVLDRKENSLLLLTEYGIDVKQYHEENEYITWEDCTLRRWLNGKFLNEAFSDSEKKLIQITNVDNGAVQRNSSYDTTGGNNTEDKVFLLSYKEAYEDYFSSNEERICMPTDYAVKRAWTNDDTGACNWWLRSPDFYQNLASNINNFGFLDSSRVDYGKNCIRPALWVNLESGSF